MRKFKCIRGSYTGITIGKVYDLIRPVKKDHYLEKIYIFDDLGNEGSFILKTISGKNVFIDVTSEYRNSVIDEIIS